MLSRDRKERSGWSQFASHFGGCLETHEAPQASQSANGGKGSSRPQCRELRRNAHASPHCCHYPQTSPNPSHHTYVLCLSMACLLRGMPFPLSHLTRSISFKSDFKWRHLSKLFPGCPTQSQKHPVLIFAHITYISIWLKRNSRLKNPNRHFNSPTNCSIYSLPFFRLNQRDSECIWDNAKLPRPLTGEFSPELA